MRREFTHGGSDRRTFLQTLAAAGVIGATQPVESALAQEEEADAYHQQLASYLQDDHGLPDAGFVYGATEAAAIETFSLDGQGAGSEEEIAVDGEDVPITVADRVTVDEDPSNDWDYTYQGFVQDRTFEAGDVLLGVAYLRSETEDAQTQAGFKYRYTDPDGNTTFMDGSLVQENATVQPDEEWTRYFFPIEVGEKPDGSEFDPYMEFWTGQTEQTIEFGGLALVDYSDSDIAWEDLPSGAPGERNPLLDYEGREEGAQWRQDARDRIEEIRKTDAAVTVVDGDGNPVPDATVDVEMAEHAFDFGAAVSTNHVNGDSEDDEIYRETFLENFNKAVIENGLKYPSFTGAWGDTKDDAYQTLEWLNERDVPTRGHYLLWEEFQTDGGGGMGIENPDDYTDEELQQLLLDRITNHAEDIGDRVVEWDMHNHPIWQPNFRSEDGRNLGWDAVLEWWEAGAAATDAELYTNEMGNVAGDFNRAEHYDLVERLVEDDAPIDGVGFMGHVQFPNGNVTPPEEMLETYDQFAELGLPILITEFDVQIGDRENADQVDWQGDFVRDFLIASFSHEAVEGVMSWGFWEDDHWRDTAAYFNSDWSVRPHGERYLDLVFNQWWTEERGQTDDDGTFAFRGFEGEYEITASDGSRAGSTTATFEDGESATVRITPKSVGDAEFTVDQHTLWTDETTTIDVTLFDEDGEELPVPDDRVTFESDAPETVAVDEDGTVSVAGTGVGTVTVTVTAYGDTAVGSARFATFGEPSIHDPAEDFSVAESSEGLYVTTYEERHGDGARFEKEAADDTGSVTYHVEEGIAAVRTDVYVNNMEIDGDGDVYEGLVFEASADGESWEAVDAEPETVEPAGDDNGYYAHRRYMVTTGIPEDATYLRVTVTESEDSWSVNVGSVDVWASTANVEGTDATGPTIVVQDLQDGATYEVPQPAAVSIIDPDSEVVERSVTLNGEDFEDGQLIARGRNVLSASATSEGDVTTRAELEVELVDEDAEDLNARLRPNTAEATVGDRLTFQVEDTTDNDNWITDLSWTFGDDETGSGWWNDHSYADPGAYVVRLEATDNEDNTTTDSVVIWVNDLQSTLATAQPSTTEAAPGERIEFRVQDTSGQGRWIDALAWDFGDGESAEGWWAAHSYDEPGTYTVTLSATDNLGYSTDGTVEIVVE